MIPVGFYAPLKSPNHPNPSGDREIAQSVMQALEHAGFAPHLASDLRSLDMKGYAEVQRGLFRDANEALPGVIQQGRQENWALWLTYHNYYKAPDLLGPRAAQALNIPYVQIESTRARKRLDGPWADFARAAEDAAEQANAIFYSTQRDAIALRNYAPQGQVLQHLHPFLRRTDLPAPSNRSAGILAAGMMRPGDKIESYRLIAETLNLSKSDWHLNIAGGGKARGDVEDLMSDFGGRVTFVGKLDAEGMARAYGAAKLFFWPGFNEAIGMVYLEAQAAGLPVLAQNRPGLIDVLAPHLDYPAPEDGPAALAARLDGMLANLPPADPIRDHIRDHHLLPSAAKTLQETLSPLIGTAP